MSVTRDQVFQQAPQRSLFRPHTLLDMAWLLLLAGAAGYTHVRYGEFMDGYEIGILYGSALMLLPLGWAWPAVRRFSIAVALVSLFAIWLYDTSLPRLAAEGISGRAALDALAGHPEYYRFFFKYLISSQAAVMWMSALFVGATVVYFMARWRRSRFLGQFASGLTWSATAMGLVGLLVRWRESYLISPDVGHIPVSNLYEVFILFAIITALIYLYYEGRYRTRDMGAYVLLVISAAVGFLLWYTFDRQAHEIQPLIPALQSYWMKIHVPANFIGYGAFSLAAMLGIAYLVEYRRFSGEGGDLHPRLAMLDDVMYKAIALGFAFFTIATVLGAMWAAEAWGGYWSWDPKETWALIVWLNYAAWLHLRLTKGWRGRLMAWWAIIGLLVTLFAFLGVNMFLSGMHSYGGL